MKTKQVGRRIRIVWISEDMLTEIFNWQSAPAGRRLAVESDVGLPDGAKVVFCFLSTERSSIGVVVSHPSFKEIPPGEKAPIHGGGKVAVIKSDGLLMAAKEYLSRISRDESGAPYVKGVNTDAERDADVKLRAAIAKAEGGGLSEGKTYAGTVDSR